MGEVAGRIGGAGAYPAIKQALETTKPVIVQLSKGVVTALNYVSKDVVQVAKNEAIGSIIRLTASNVLRTSGGNLITNLPTIYSSINSSKCR